MLYSGSVRCAKQTLPPQKGGGCGYVKTLLLPKNLANEKMGGLCKTPHAVVLRRNAPPPPLVGGVLHVPTQRQHAWFVGFHLSFRTLSFLVVLRLHLTGLTFTMGQSEEQVSRKGPYGPSIWTFPSHGLRRSQLANYFPKIQALCDEERAMYGGTVCQVNGQAAGGVSCSVLSNSPNQNVLLFREADLRTLWCGTKIHYLPQLHHETENNCGCIPATLQPLCQSFLFTP